MISISTLDSRKLHLFGDKQLLIFVYQSVGNGETIKKIIFAKQYHLQTHLKIHIQLHKWCHILLATMIITTKFRRNHFGGWIRNEMPLFRAQRISFFIIWRVRHLDVCHNFIFHSNEIVKFSVILFGMKTNL